VLPYRWHDGTEQEFASSRNALLAAPRRHPSPEHPFTLSPSSLGRLRAGTRLVLRWNALRHSRNRPEPVIAVVAAGERWHGATGPLRVAVEDLVGAGAVLGALADFAADLALSPEAMAAVAAVGRADSALDTFLASCTSGRELIERSFAVDVTIAAALDVSDLAPVLVDDELRAKF